jgi:tetratricopeptide (TPR) repeat protein
VHAGRLGIPWVSSVTLDELRHARQILAASPTALHALKKLTKGLLDRGQLDEALAVTRRYAQLYPDDTGHVHFVAGYFGIAGRYRDQAELMEPAVARRPDYGPLCMLGNALAKGGRPHQAIEVLNRATQIHPGSFLAFHYLGEIYTALGRYQEAIAAYEAELVVRPRSRETQQRIDNIRKAMSARVTAPQ